MLIAQLAQALQKPRRGRKDATLALNRLDDDGAGSRRDVFAHGIQIVVRQMGNTFGQRAKSLRVFRLSTDRHREQRAAVKRIREGDDFILIALKRPCGSVRTREVVTGIFARKF